MIFLNSNNLIYLFEFAIRPLLSGNAGDIVVEFVRMSVQGNWCYVPGGVCGDGGGAAVEEMGVVQEE